MSAIEFYLSHGYTPKNKSVIFAGGDTLAVWTPEAGKRVIITDVAFATNTENGTIAFFFADRQNPVARIAIFGFSGSSSVSPHIGCWESTAVSGAIYARKNTTLGELSLSLTGFEL